MKQFLRTTFSWENAPILAILTGFVGLAWIASYLSQPAVAQTPGGLQAPSYSTALSARETFYRDVVRRAGKSSFLWVIASGETTMSTDVANGFAGKTLTYNESLVTFDEQPEYLGAGFSVELNGTDEEADTPDSADLTFAASAFSMVALVKMSDRTNSTIIAKWDETNAAEAREYEFGFNATDSLFLTLVDESATSPTIALTTDSAAAIPEGEWALLTATFNGGTSGAGITFYKNGSSVAGTVADGDGDGESDFVAMENLSTIFSLGYIEGTGGAKENFFDGEIAFVLVTQKELSANDVGVIVRSVNRYFGLTL